MSFFGQIFSFFRRKSQPSVIEEELEERRLRPRVNPKEDTRVLVIDDSPTILTAMKRFLESAHCVFLGALDAKMGMEVALTQKPDMIFLDIVMPGINGFAALRALRKNARTRDIPIVMMSGNEQAKAQFFGAHIGADDFMKKPFTRFEVFAHIARLLDANCIPRRPPLDLPDNAQMAEPEAAPVPPPRNAGVQRTVDDTPKAAPRKLAETHTAQPKPTADVKPKPKPPAEAVAGLAEQPVAASPVHPPAHAAAPAVAAPRTEHAPEAVPTLSAQVVSIAPPPSPPVTVPSVSPELLRRIARLAQLAQSDPEALKTLVVLSSHLCAQFIEAQEKTPVDTTTARARATATAT
ncbi:MAG: response regulator [Azoarcus sp.]|nr:response regulator [Azoarcus sp.]